MNRLAYISTFVPFIERMIPREWISPIAIQHTLESHMNEPSSGSSSTTTSSGQNGTSSNNNKSTGQQNGSAGTNNNNGLWSYLFGGMTTLEQSNQTQSASSSQQSQPKWSSKHKLIQKNSNSFFICWSSCRFFYFKCILNTILNLIHSNESTITHSLNYFWHSCLFVF